MLLKWSGCIDSCVSELILQIDDIEKSMGYIVYSGYSGEYYCVFDKVVKCVDTYEDARLWVESQYNDLCNNMYKLKPNEPLWVYINNKGFICVVCESTPKTKTVRYISNGMLFVENNPKTKFTTHEFNMVWKKTNIDLYNNDLFINEQCYNGLRKHNLGYYKLCFSYKDGCYNQDVEYTYPELIEQMITKDKV